jgi:RecA-family ATPase
MPGPDDAPVSWADFDKALGDEAPAAPPVAEALGDERLDDVPRGPWDDEAEVEGARRPAEGDPWARLVPLAAAALANEPPPRRWLLMRQGKNGDVGMFPAGKVGILSAPGGTGKTMALAGLALAVATGRAWLQAGGAGDKGKPGGLGFPVASRGRVALLLGEEDAEDIGSRLYYSARLMDLTADEAELAARRVIVGPLAGEDVSLVTEDGELSARAAALYACLEAMSDENDHWALILVDPLSRFGGIGAEADNALATRAIQALERLTRLPGRPAVLMAHHERKGGGEGAEAVRGASAIVDGARWVARLSPVKTKPGGKRWTTEKGDRCVSFEVVKTNYGPPLDEPLVLVLDGKRHGALRVAFDGEGPTADDLNDEPKPARASTPKKDKAKNNVPADVPVEVDL